MGNELKYITPELKNWISELFLTEKPSFYIMRDLEKIPLPKEIMEVDIKEDRVYRSSPLKQNQGYLLFKSKNANEIESEFMLLARNIVESKKYTSNGLVNYLVLIDRLGSIYDQQHYDLTQDFISSINKDTYIELIDSLVRLFNNSYQFSQFSSQEHLTCFDWDNLFFSIQYIERINNPIDILRRAINFRINDLDLLSIIASLKPDPRAALLEYGVDTDILDEDDLKSFLQKHNQEIPFISAYILDEHKKKPLFVGRKLLSYLISSHWSIAGKYFFQKAVNRSRIPINEDTKKLLTQELDIYLKNEFSSGKGRSILQDFNWPEDYMAFGGWLMYLNKQDQDYEFDNKFYNDLTISFSKHISKISKEIKFSFNDYQKSSKLWFSNIDDPRAQYATAYIHFSIMQSSQQNFEIFLKQFKDLCFTIKQLYYGSYTANILARHLTNDLLSLCLAYCSIPDETQVRVVAILSIFNDLLAYPWIVQTERENIIWNHRNEEKRHADADLLLVLAKIREPRENYIDSIAILKAQIERLATTVWPV